jgi:hypothetical protein
MPGWQQKITGTAKIKITNSEQDETYAHTHSKDNHNLP